MMNTPSTKPRILVSRKVFPEVLERLRQHFIVEDNQSDTVLGAEELKLRLTNKAGLLVAPTDGVSADVLAAATDLKAVCNIAVGFNNIDVAAATRAGVMVTNTPGVLDDTTADMAWTLLMATARNVSAAERWLRDGEWKGWECIQWLGADVHHATLGILGMGRIGQVVARRSLGFDMKVIYHNRSRLPAERESACRATWVDKETLLREADFLVLVLPYSPASHHAIGAAELALMKSTACLINIARGGIVDDEALISALRQRRLFGAGLDVFEGEPGFNPGYLELDNVTLTPHIASCSGATRMAMAMCAADNLIAALTGQPPPNLLNPEALQ